MIQQCQDPGLPFESLESVFVLRERIGEHFERHWTIELGVHRPVDDAHPASTNLLEEPVVEDDAAFELGVFGVRWEVRDRGFF